MPEKLTSYDAQWENKQPDQLNYLRPLGFKFMIQTLPKVTYFCQSASIPAISMGNAVQATPFVDAPVPGDKLVFGDLNIKFMIQEDMSNYLELYNWLIGLGFPVSRQQYSDFIKSRQQSAPKNKETFSDSSLLVLGSENKPIVRVNFYDCFPVSLSSVDFDVSSGNTTYFQANATFKYLRYDITQL